ncbi:MAG: alpha/beta hydrolase [Pseudomonadota bacterium]
MRLARVTTLLVLWLLIALALIWCVGFFVLQGGPHTYAEVKPEFAERAEQYLDASLVELPADWQRKGLFISETVELETGFLDSDMDEPKGVVVMVPGYTAPLEMLAPGIRHFHDAGFHVAAISPRGQGRSYRPLDDPEKAWLENYEVWADDFEGFIGEVEERYQLPIFVYGISMGVHIALRNEALNETVVEAYALTVPMIKIKTDPFPYRVATGISAFYAMTGLDDIYAPGRGKWKPGQVKWDEPTACNANAQTAWTRDALFALEPDLRAHAPSVKWVQQTARSTAYLQSDEAHERITKPILMHNVGRDEIVSAPAASELCTKLSGCTEVFLPGAGHCVEREDKAVADAILLRASDFFAEQLQ